MVIYLDSDFKCYVTNDGTKIEMQTNFFDNKCSAFVEGYRCIPDGQTWMREDGVIFVGEMISPWKSYDELDQAQREYEQELAEAARILLGGN